MDYSAISSDDQSPWSTSPKASAHAHAATLPTPPLGNSMYSSTTASFPSPALSEGFQDRASDGEAEEPSRLEVSQESLPQEAQNRQQAHPSQYNTAGQQRQASAAGQVSQHGKQASEPATIAHNGQRSTARTPPHFKLVCKITGLERTGKKDIILRFDAQASDLGPMLRISLTYDQTNLPKFRSTQFRDVRRTHAEFVKFSEHLISSNPEAFVPAVPQAVTSAGAGTDEDEHRVKFTMQKWLNVVCSNQVLIRDDEMIFFIESDFGYSPVMRMKQPATGVRRKVIKQFAPPPDDTPELQEARPVVKLFYLGTMDTGQKIDKVVKTRKCR